MTDAAAPSRRRATLLLVALLAVLAVVAVVGVVVARGSGGSAADGGDWNGLVGVDPESGDLVVYDAEGEERERIDTGVDGAFNAVGRGSHVLTWGDGRAAVVDVTSGDVVWDDAIDREVVSWARGTAAPVVLVGEPSGGDLRVVHVEHGTDLRLGDALPRAEPHFVLSAVAVSPDGSVLAAPSLSTDEVSVVADLESGDAHEVAGRAVTVTEDQAVVLEGSAEQASVRFVGSDGSDRGTTPLPRWPRAILPIGEDELLLVHEDEDGTVVSTTSEGADEPNEVGSLDLTGVGLSEAFPAQGRLVVTGEEGTVVFDDEGREVATVAGDLLPSYGVARDAAACFVVQDGDDLVLHDLDSGDELNRTTPEVPGPTSASVDGCTIGGVGLLLAEDAELDVDRSSVVLAAPDGSAAIVRGGGKAELVDLTDPDGERLELARPVSGFVRR